MNAHNTPGAGGPEPTLSAESVVANPHVQEAIQNALHQARRDLRATNEAEIPAQAKWRREAHPGAILRLEERIAALKAALIDGPGCAPDPHITP